MMTIRQVFSEIMALEFKISAKIMGIWFILVILGLELDFQLGLIPGERAAGALFGTFMTLLVVAAINYRSVRNQIKERTSTI
jgi:hypothetical protein